MTDGEITNTSAPSGNLNWEELLQQLYPRALAIAGRIMRDRELAHDVAQNALLKVYRHLGEVRDSQALPAWLNRVVSNEAYLALRVYQREAVSETVASLAGTAGDPAERATFRTEFLRAMRTLPPEFQEAVVLCDVMGWKVQDAAAHCGVPLGTLKSRLSRGRENLRGLLSDFRQRREERAVDRPMEDLLFDYLEGRLDAVAEAQLESRLAQDQDLRGRLAEQREFLRLLHSLTGKISLSSAEIAAKMGEVYAEIRDYSHITEQTLISGGSPQTLVHQTWFKKPDLLRSEAQHPLLGSFIAIVRGQDAVLMAGNNAKPQRTRVEAEMLKSMGVDFGATLRALSTGHSTRLLGTEYVEGRNSYHLLLLQAAPGAAEGQVSTHIWLDKLTWMPLLTEEYNSEGVLVSRKVVRNLTLNTGLPDSLFEFPPEVSSEAAPAPEAKAPRACSLAEVKAALPFEPFLLTDSPLVLHSCHLVDIAGSPIALLNYHLPGDPLPEVTLTQAAVYHTNLPPGIPREEIEIGGEKGIYIPMETFKVKGFVSLQRDGVYLNLGGNGSKEQILAWAGSLAQDRGGQNAET